MTTMTVLDSTGATVTVEKPLTPGRAAAASSRPVALSSEDFAAIDGIETLIGTTNSLLTTQAGYLDGVEGGIASTNALLTLIGGYVDQLEGFTDGLETMQGAVNETAPANDTASSGANGRLQRIAQRLTTQIAAMGAASDVAWASGDGSHTALLKTIATAVLDTTTASPVAVRTPCDVIAVTPTLDTSIYASGDVLFATTAIAGVTRANDERAVLMSVAVVDKDDQKPAFRLLFFKANVTSGAFNGAPSISDADAANYLGHIDIAAADYADLGGVSVACQKSINMLLEAVSGGTTVYCFAYLTAGTPTHTASGLVLNFGVIQS